MVVMGKMEDSRYAELKKNLDWNGMRKVLIPLYRWFFKTKGIEPAKFLSDAYQNLEQLLNWENFINAPKVPDDLLDGIGCAGWAMEYADKRCFSGLINRDEIIPKMENALRLMEKEVSQ